MIVAGRVGATDAHGHGCPADTSGVAAAARSARLATRGVSSPPWAGRRLVAVCAAAGARRPCSRFLASACFCGRSLMASAHTARSARHMGFPAEHGRQGTQRVASVLMHWLVRTRHGSSSVCAGLQGVGGGEAFAQSD